jgi:two-component system, OmpR family, heavy metal sensor histidine kinase CusS
MTLSIRTRLLFWVVGGMAVLLALFAFVLYEVISASLVASFDDVLTSTARVISASVEQTDQQVKADIEETEIPEFRRTDRPDYFQVWRADGEVLARSSSLKGAGLDRFEGEVGALVFRPVRLPDGRAGRAVGLLFTPKADEEAGRPVAAPKAVLVVARSTAALDAETAFLRWLLAMGTGGTILLALLVGAVVVRQGLRPLDALAARIAGIHQGDLSTRIPVDRMSQELTPVVERLNGLLQRLEEAFRRERTFTADAAHELRTPLAGLRSTLEVALARPRDGAEYRQAMTESLGIIQHTQALVDSLLALARLDGGAAGLHSAALRLDELLDEAWRPLAATALARNLTVDRRISLDAICTTDRASLLSILTALLTNAVDYTDAGGRIDIAAAPSGRSVDVRMANTGCRLSGEDIRHVFGRFWRGDASRTHTGVHCGLGLALVQRAVESLGGSVTASVTDETFSIRLALPAAPCTPQRVRRIEPAG